MFNWKNTYCGKYVPLINILLAESTHLIVDTFLLKVEAEDRLLLVWDPKIKKIELKIHSDIQWHFRDYWAFWDTRNYWLIHLPANSWVMDFWNDHSTGQHDWTNSSSILTFLGFCSKCVGLIVFIWSQTASKLVPKL